MSAIKSYLPVLFTQGRKRSRKTSGDSVATTYMLVFAVCGVLLLIGLTRIYLEQRTVKLSQTWLGRKQELKTVLMERQNLLIEREHHMSGEHILRQAAALGLRPPLPGQVREMSPQALAERPDQ